ncbi:hypothetical protein EBO15_11300 [Actinomadura harenae]|uniref:XRE family transcriptional regulator n=2 Tax=Actinomadura harenae TaxID=2483351 RepID=A0A3M2M529_9ACTN|nr:hypothetical protein EBO15_11300 [Actinomadura harenae]
MARQLQAAAGHQHGAIDSLARQIREWEKGRHFPRDWASAYASAFAIPVEQLFAPDLDDVSPLTMLLQRPAITSPTTTAPRLGIDHVEALLARLYRFDDAFGGNELVSLIADQVNHATALLAEPTLPSVEQRLHAALAGLTQMAGWLSIDANQHSAASRHLAATVYAAHEADDTALAAHAMGYMSLHALYRDQPRRALSLADTAAALANGAATPRTRAVLHTRVARAHARLGEDDACRRQLDLSQAAYADREADGEPHWTTYVTDIEVTAQAGACYLDLQRPREAITTLTSAVELVESTAPDHVRDLAHYKTRLATAYLLDGDLEAAVSTAVEANSLAVQIGSARVGERFRELIDKMRPFDSPLVQHLVESISAE